MKQIAVATDFSTRSDRALRRAVLLARQRGAALALIHVVDDDQPEYLIKSQRRAAEELLEQTAATIGRVDKPARTSSTPAPDRRSSSRTASFSAGSPLQSTQTIPLPSTTTLGASSSRSGARAAADPSSVNQRGFHRQSMLMIRYR